jgi:O-antigen ligase
MLKRIFDRATEFHISLFLIGLMFCIPFIVVRHEPPIAAFYQEWIAGAFGLLAIIPFLRSTFWYKSQTSIVAATLKIPQAALIFLGLAAILCVQWALGMLHSSQYALLILSYFVWAFLLVVLGSYLRRELGWEKLVTTLAWGLVTAGIINICITVLQFVMLTGGNIPWLPNLSGYGAISQANNFANFCALATASLIYLYARGYFSLSFFSLLLLCFVVMLSASGSRSVWLYLTAFTVLISIVHVNLVKHGQETDRTRGAWRAGLTLLPLFILIQLVIYYLIPNDLANLPTERLVNSVNEHSTSLRLKFWHDSLRIFLLHPWLGVGIEKLRISTFLLVDSPTTLASKQVFEHAHNLFLNLLAEMGIGAVLIAVVGLWSWIKSFNWNKLNMEAWWLVSLLTVLGIHSMLEYPLWYAFFLGITSILLGVGDENFITINLSKFSRKIAQSSLFLVFILGLASLSTMLIANVKLENWWYKVVNENIYDKALLDWARENSLLTPYADSMHAATIGNIDEHNISKTILLYQSDMDFMPIDRVSYQLALLLKLDGQNENAIKQLNRSLIAFPESLKPSLESTPEKYKQEFLDLLADTRPKPVK